MLGAVVAGLAVVVVGLAVVGVGVAVVVGAGLAVVAVGLAVVVGRTVDGDVALVVVAGAGGRVDGAGTGRATVVMEPRGAGG